MIKYRYNMSIDPEPVNVNRVQVHVWDTWVRTSCKLKSGGFVYGRPKHLRVGRSHRSVPKKQWRRERDFPRTLCRTFDGKWDHIHWSNGDRHRAWGNFRGHTGEVIDLDAFRRMRTMYRRRK